MPYADPEVHKAHCRQYYAAHREEILAQKKEQYAEDPTKHQSWRTSHLDQAREQDRVYHRLARAADPEKYRARCRAWYAAHGLEYSRQWRLAHPGCNQKRVKFLGKNITLDRNPRLGICSECGRSVKSGEIRRTGMHHDKYDPTDVLRHTRELCTACHLKVHVSGFRTKH